MIGAQTPNGDVIFVVNLPTSTTAPKATEALEKGMRESGRGGIMTTSSMNHGSTVIGLIGVKGTDGGLASPRSEMLARRCATEPRASPHLIT